MIAIRATAELLVNTVNAIRSTVNFGLFKMLFIYFVTVPTHQ